MVRVFDDGWFNDHETRCAFARMMVEREGWDVEAVLYFFEKPWKWTPEYEAWLASERAVGT